MRMMSSFFKEAKLSPRLMPESLSFVSRGKKNKIKKNHRVE